MKVTLIRHGMPEAHHKYSVCTVLKGYQLIGFVSDWNTCALSSENKVPDALKEHIQDGDCFVNSTLRRTKDSLRLLGIEGAESLALLNEAELPHGFLQGLYLPITVWRVLGRLLWMFGYSKNTESYADFKARMRKAYDFIDSQCLNSDHLVIMAHGFTNMQLKRVMKSEKWRHLGNHGGHGYWSFDSFERWR